MARAEARWYSGELVGPARPGPDGGAATVTQQKKRGPLMEPNESRPRWSVLLSPVTALALAGLFFLPWLKLSCNAGEFARMALPPGAPPIPAELAEGGDVATATGLQLAQGEFTPSKGNVTKEQMAGPKKGFPRARAWAWGGVVLPVLAVLLTAGAACGKVHLRTAGKLVLLLAAGGMCVAIAAASVDFVDDAMDQARAEFDEQSPGAMPPGAERMMDQAMDQAKENMSKIVQTKATWALWTAMGLWLVLGFFGLVMSNADDVLPEFRQTATLVARAAAPGGARSHHSLVRPAPAPAPQTPVYQPQSAPASDASDLPDFGPSLTPLAPREPAPQDAPADQNDRPRSLCEPF